MWLRRCPKSKGGLATSPLWCTAGKLHPFYLRLCANVDVSLLQWHSEPLWHVLCHSHYHWTVQDWGSGGCLPGGEGPQGAETWSCAHCGKKYACIQNVCIIAIIVVLIIIALCSRPSTSLCLKLWLYTWIHFQHMLIFSAQYGSIEKLHRIILDCRCARKLMYCMTFLLGVVCMQKCCFSK